MMFYRYLGSHWIETLEDSCFKMTSITDFNDPLDCRGRICTGTLSPIAVDSFVSESSVPFLWKAAPEFAANSFVQELNHKIQNRTLFQEMKVLCFSACEDKDPAQKLMWSHYANGHKGVRLGLQLDDPHFPFYLDSVKYCSERPSLDLNKVTSVQNDDETKQFWRVVLTTKSTEWAYEREYRIIADVQHLTAGKDANGNDAWFWQFDLSMLKSIDVGCMMRQQEIDAIIARVKENRIGARIRHEVLNQLNYDIAYETIYEPSCDGAKERN